MNQHQHRGVTFQQVFQCLSREGWFSQWGLSGMSYFKPGTVVGTAVFNQNVFVGEANVEMYWRHSGDWQRVERMIFQAQLNNQMHQNQLNQQRQHHQLQQHMAAVASMPRGIPMPQQGHPPSGAPTTLPSAAELMDQRARSLNYPLDMLCDILAVDRDTPNGQARQRQARQQLQQQQQHLQQHHLAGMHSMGDPSRFSMLDPSHPSSILFPQSIGPTPTMQLIPSHTPPPSKVTMSSGTSLPDQAAAPSHDGLLLVDPSPSHTPPDAAPSVSELSDAPTTMSAPSNDKSASAPVTKPPPAKPKKRSRNLYIRLDQMKTVLRKHGWKWVEGPKGFIYCKPHVQVANRGKTMSGKDGVDYFSGRQSFEAYVRSQKSLMELIQNDLKEKHGGAVFSMEIPPEDQLCAPTYKERAELARRKLMKEKRMAALALRRSQEAAIARAAAVDPAGDVPCTTASSEATTVSVSDGTTSVAVGMGASSPTSEPAIATRHETPLQTAEAPPSTERHDAQTSEEAVSAVDGEVSAHDQGHVPPSVDSPKSTTLVV
ncbi:hypothetical protein DYB32_004895 [Aphanomyces invadans]|uniref:Uncharacterized protein n=1 Tax=Aphanomyces invadans TaxID=157072 RepID=A0A3R6WLS5_9STRA|nr:hypothetical protein DYB32_004895 [Aphanomyces invadans]